MKMTLSTAHAASLLTQDENANWSWAGALAMIAYFEEIEEDTGEEIEFNAVAIRCDFAQYESLQDWLVEYFGKDLPESLELAGIEKDGIESEDELNEAIREYIEDRGTLIEFDGGIIVSNF
jgi:hypothetical protein